MAPRSSRTSTSCCGGSAQLERAHERVGVRRHELVHPLDEVELVEPTADGERPHDDAVLPRGEVDGLPRMAVERLAPPLDDARLLPRAENALDGAVERKAGLVFVVRGRDQGRRGAQI